jgi:nucleotide-binding universal stress UspA family protein
MKKILCAVDFSEITEKVISYSINLAKSNNGSIKLLHVAEPPSAFLGDDFGPQIARDIKAETIKKEHRVLNSIAERINSEGIKAVAILDQGSTVETIIKHARKMDADVIVLGSHGKGVIASAIMGSTCEGIINKAKRPVLIIPHSM